jgi:hypothetical protein
VLGSAKRESFKRLRILVPSNPPASFNANLVAVPGKTCPGDTICAGFVF